MVLFSARSADLLLSINGADQGAIGNVIRRGNRHTLPMSGIASLVSVAYNLTGGVAGRILKIPTTFPP